MFGTDPELTAPEHGDYRPRPGSPAQGYGCQTFGAPSSTPEVVEEITPVFARAADRVDVSGPIAIDTVWDTGLVRVVGDVEVLAEVTLTVAAGARVEFAGHHALRVVGRLLAVGTAEVPITFTSAVPQDFALDHTLAGSWNGLRFENSPATGGTSRLEHCVVEYAKATWGKFLVGPLVLVDVSDVQIVNTIIRHNVADLGAALFCVHGAAPELSGCLITDNHALAGGSAVFCVDAYPRLRGCTIVDNHDLNPEVFAEAAAVLTYYGKPRTTGGIFWGNTTHYFAPAQTWQTKPFATTWSDVEGGHVGEGNLDADPLFAGAGAHPYALTPHSPCMDQGPAETTDWPPEDLAGRIRVQNGRVDLGAYEVAVGTAVLADASCEARLHPAFPNPCNPRTTIAFDTPAPQLVSLGVYDLRGRRVVSLLADVVGAGRHELAWDGCDGAGVPVSSGTYVCRLRVGGRTVTRTLAVLR